MLFSANCSGRRCEHNSNSFAFSPDLEKQPSQNTWNSGKRIHLINYAPIKCIQTCRQWVRFISIPMQKNSRRQNLTFYFWANFPSFIHPRIVLTVNWKKKNPGKNPLQYDNSYFSSFTREIQKTLHGNYRSSFKKACEDKSNSLTPTLTDLSLSSVGWKPELF